MPSISVGVIDVEIVEFARRTIAAEVAWIGFDFGLVEKAEIKANPKDFRRYGSARKLYNFNIDHADAY